MDFARLKPDKPSRASHGHSSQESRSRHQNLAAAAFTPAGYCHLPSPTSTAKGSTRTVYFAG